MTNIFSSSLENSLQSTVNNMYGEETKVFVPLLFGLVLIFSCHVPAKTYPSNSYAVNSPSLHVKNNDTFVTLNEQLNYKSQNSFPDKEYETYAEMHKQINFLTFDKNIRKCKNRNLVSKVNKLNPQLYRETISTSSNLRSNLLENRKAWFRQLFDGRLVKRNVNSRKGMPREKQKKAKALGRLLMNNDSENNENKNNEDIQDDYIEDQDDAYFEEVNKKKMNWEEFQNEDGASVMELIALNARHKTNMYSTDNDEYLYR